VTMTTFPLNCCMSSPCLCIDAVVEVPLMVETHEESIYFRGQKAFVVRPTAAKKSCPRLFG
jgi:hypothetical protein